MLTTYVRAEGDRFRLTSGLRRFSAARMLEWPTITAFVRTLSADDAYLVDLVENLQREDLSPEEEADALGEALPYVICLEPFDIDIQISLLLHHPTQ